MSNNKKSLITQDIIAALDWKINSPKTKMHKSDPNPDAKTWRQQAEEDWVTKLTRDYGPWEDSPDAVKLGVDLEKNVARLAKMHKVTGSDNMQKLIQTCIGSVTQQKVKKTEEIAGETCFLYGKMDFYFPGKKIIDLKATSKFNEDKYYDSFQHPLYCYCSGVQDFSYLVAVWEKGTTLENPVIAEVHELETGFFGDPEILKKQVHERIEWFIETVKAQGDWDLYKEKYCLY